MTSLLFVGTKSPDFTTDSIRVLNDNGIAVLLDGPGEEEPGLPLHHPLLNEQGGFPAVSL